VEEAMLRKANQKRSLDDLVIQKGEFDWRSLFSDEAALTKALGEFEDSEDAHAAAVAAREAVVMEGADEADFGGDADVEGPGVVPADDINATPARVDGDDVEPDEEGEEKDDPEEEAEEEGGTTIEYMLSFVRRDYEFFRDWRL
jgi:helicase SWR1